MTTQIIRYLGTFLTPMWTFLLDNVQKIVAPFVAGDGVPAWRFLTVCLNFLIFFF